MTIDTAYAVTLHIASPVHCHTIYGARYCFMRCTLVFDENVKVTLFFYYHKRMHTSHLEIVWPVNR